jgi:hypothetical protein
MSRIDLTNAARQARWQERRKLRFRELEQRVAELQWQLADAKARLAPSARRDRPPRKKVSA